MNDRLDLIPAALYARVSSDRRDVDLSVAAQLRALRDYAEKNGYHVAREYIDEAESGLIEDRPQFRKMLDEAAKPEAPFKEILVWKFSRFNLYYRALKDTPPRLGSTTRADWLRHPFPSPGRAPLRDSTDADWNPHRPARSFGLGSASSDPVSTPT